MLVATKAPGWTASTYACTTIDTIAKHLPGALRPRRTLATITAQARRGTSTNNYPNANVANKPDTNEATAATARAAE